MSEVLLSFSAEILDVLAKAFRKLKDLGVYVEFKGETMDKYNCSFFRTFEEIEEMKEKTRGEKIENQI